MAVFLRVFKGFDDFWGHGAPAMFFSLLACFFFTRLFFPLLATSKEKKHLPLPGLQDSLLTRDAQQKIKFARPKLDKNFLQYALQDLQVAGLSAG